MTSFKKLNSIIQQKPKIKTMIEMGTMEDQNKPSETIEKTIANTRYDSRVTASQATMWKDTFKKTMEAANNNKENAPKLNKAILNLIENFA